MSRRDSTTSARDPRKQIMKSIRSVIVEQFGRPRGLLGRLAGLMMRVRASNRERNERTLAILDIQPEDHVLEIGFGPGLSIEKAAKLASRGKVIGIDHSELMLRQATKRNAEAIRQGRVELRLGTPESMQALALRCDKVFAVNVFMFWKDPVTVLRSLRNVMKPGATIALTLQPRIRGANNDDALQAGERMATALRDAGFAPVSVEIFEMAPVNVACVHSRNGTCSMAINAKSR